MVFKILLRVCFHYTFLSFVAFLVSSLSLQKIMKYLSVTMICLFRQILTVSNIFS